MSVTKRTCPHCGESLQGMLGGRPRRDVDVPRLLDAYKRTQCVRAAAREVGVPPGTVWHRLRDAGALPQTDP